jgi:hypothetical protein
MLIAGNESSNGCRSRRTHRSRVEIRAESTCIGGGTVTTRRGTTTRTRISRGRQLACRRRQFGAALLRPTSPHRSFRWSEHAAVAGVAALGRDARAVAVRVNGFDHDGATAAYEHSAGVRLADVISRGTNFAGSACARDSGAGDRNPIVGPVWPANLLGAHAASDNQHRGHEHAANHLAMVTHVQTSSNRRAATRHVVSRRARVEESTRGPLHGCYRLLYVGYR